MKRHNILYIAAGLLASACTSEAPDVELSVAADKTDVAVGEPVTLSITHNVQGLTVFTGDEGHNYYKSAAYLLANASAEDLKTHNYRIPDPDVRPMRYDFSDAEPGAPVIGTGMVDVISVSTGGSLLNHEADIVVDPATGKPTLRIIATHPDWWYQALRVNLDTKLGANRNLTLTMRFEKNVLEDIYSGAKHPEVPDFGVVLRLGGKAKGSDQTVFCDDTVWDIYWTPSLTQQNYTVDLNRVIAAWQGGTGMEMETLSYAQFLFTSIGSVGYVGEIYVDAIQYGDYDYVKFDTGHGMTLGEGPGTVNYTYSFDEPGTYEMVVLGTNTSWKHYTSDGYNNGIAGKVSADEYNFDRQMKSVKVNVH